MTNFSPSQNRGADNARQPQYPQFPLRKWLRNNGVRPERGNARRGKKVRIPQKFVLGAGWDETGAFSDFFEKLTPDPKNSYFHKNKEIKQ